MRRECVGVAPLMSTRSAKNRTLSAFLVERIQRDVMTTPFWRCDL